MSTNDDEQPPAPAGNAAVGAAANSGHSLKLVQFWPDAPKSWFLAAEAQFRLRGITSDQDRVCLLLSALPRDSFRLIQHLIGDDVDAAIQRPYAELKAALVSSHQLSDYQKVEHISRMDRLGGRKPSELLAAMMEFCPAGHESSPFLAFFFLHRLPRELRCLLSDADMSDLRLLAEKADRLAALHSHHDFDAVAAVDGGSSDSDEDAVVAAAMRSKQPAKKKAAANKSGGKDSKSGGKDSKSGGSSLCYFHLKFGDKAYKCVSRKCSWPEN